jgi:hypothetical protein
MRRYIPATDVGLEGIIALALKWNAASQRAGLIIAASF